MVKKPLPQDHPLMTAFWTAIDTGNSKDAQNIFASIIKESATTAKDLYEVALEILFNRSYEQLSQPVGLFDKEVIINVGRTLRWINIPLSTVQNEILGALKKTINDGNLCADSEERIQFLYNIRIRPDDAIWESIQIANRPGKTPPPFKPIKTTNMGFGQWLKWGKLFPTSGELATV